MYVYVDVQSFFGLYPLYLVVSPESMRQKKLGPSTMAALASPQASADMQWASETASATVP